MLVPPGDKPPYVPQTPSDFRNFLYMVWKHLNLPAPTAIQYDIAYFIQHGGKRLVIEAFRGVGKSWITSAFVVWTLDHHPDWNILVVSASKTRADDFSTFTLRLIHEMPCLAHLIPGEGQRNSKVSFDVLPAPASHAPSVKSLGITSQLAGSRADLVVPDDIEVPNNSQTQMMRDKLSEQVKEFDAVVKPGGRIVFLGTPQHEQSIYNKLPERGYTTKIWPARYPDAKRQALYGDRLAKRIVEMLQAGAAVGSPTDPKRFDDMDLREREASYGKAGFALQFMLDTSLSDIDRYPLRVSDLLVMALNPTHAPEHVVWAASPELIWNTLPNVAMKGDHYYRPMSLVGSWVPYTGCVMAIDPSGRGKDELGYAVVKMLNGQLFVMACSGLQGGYKEENLTFLAELAKKFGVNHIRIESNFGDGMFSALLKPFLGRIHPCFVEDVPHYKQKELRILDALEPVMSRHKLIFDVTVIEEDYRSTQERGTETSSQYQLIHQMTRLTKDRGALSHDDRVDALAIAVQYWVEQMSQDIEKAKDARKEALLKADLECFLRHVVGGPQKTSRQMAGKSTKR